jgi:catechol 2,3-dioxygenase-like lactoylglutathione lyase family enzyme
MFDHIRLPVSDYERSKRFYAAALQALGSGLLVEERAPDGRGGDAGFGSARRPQFWIRSGPVAGSVHVAFLAADRGGVRAFHVAALAAGGSDNGAPGLRPHYHPNYFAAFVLDPDGHNVEAVCHAPGAFEDQFPGQ